MHSFEGWQADLEVKYCHFSQTKSTVIVHFILLDTMTDKDLFVLLQILEPATPKWKTIGLALGFLYDQLTVIEQKPTLIPEGDSGYICDMLNQQLKWAPPKHDWPTVTALATALQNCQQESLAVNLRAKFIQEKGMCILCMSSYSLMRCRLTL